MVTAISDWFDIPPSVHKRRLNQAYPNCRCLHCLVLDRPMEEGSTPNGSESHETVHQHTPPLTRELRSEGLTPKSVKDRRDVEVQSSNE